MAWRRPIAWIARYRIMIGGTISVLLTIAGIGGLPDDVEQWSRWLSWMNGDGGRWLFLMAGVALFFLTFSNRIEFALPALARGGPRIPVDALESAFLHYREHCGVSWRPRITNAAPVIVGPFCPEDHTLLKYKRPLEDWEPTPRREPTLADQLLRSTHQPLLGELQAPEPVPEELPREEIREIRGADQSEDERGPYCERCGRFRRMPKTVDECRLDVLQEVRKDYGLG